MHDVPFHFETCHSYCYGKCRKNVIKFHVKRDLQQSVCDSHNGANTTGSFNFMIPPMGFQLYSKSVGKCHVFKGAPKSDCHSVNGLPNTKWNREKWRKRTHIFMQKCPFQKMLCCTCVWYVCVFGLTEKVSTSNWQMKWKVTRIFMENFFLQNSNLCASMAPIQ